MTDTIKAATRVCRIVRLDDAHEPRRKRAQAVLEEDERALSDLSFESNCTYETEG